METKCFAAASYTKETNMRFGIVHSDPWTSAAISLRLRAVNLYYACNLFARILGYCQGSVQAYGVCCKSPCRYFLLFSDSSHLNPNLRPMDPRFLNTRPMLLHSLHDVSHARWAGMRMTISEQSLHPTKKSMHFELRLFHTLHPY